MTTTKPSQRLLATRDVPPLYVLTPEPLESLLDCHRKLAELLSQMIDDDLPASAAIALDSTTFERLSRLAVDTGTISRECLPVLLELDQLQQRLAQRCDATIEPSDAEAVLATVRPLDLSGLDFGERATPQQEVTGIAIVFMAWLNAAHAKRRLMRRHPGFARDAAARRAVLAAWGDERYPTFVPGEE